MVSSLKSFIKAVRSSKTILEERSTIRKESAKIRTHFRDVNLDHQSRRILISKLLYLYILGEPTHFGQVECIKLLLSNKFLDKKLGYMLLSLLLDENQEVLTLLTNSLNNDMNHSNQHVVGLLITTLGNIASLELARDLYTDIEKAIDSPKTFLRKKLAMCAARLVAKDPDLSEIFLPKLPLLIAGKNHGVLLGTLKLTHIIYKVDESTHEMLIKKIVPAVLNHLRTLIFSIFSPDHDVDRVPDPFLFCSILQTLRDLLENVQSGPDLEQFNDMLTEVSSMVDHNKNAGHAILYETVKTIFHINSDPSLKVLGVNILGKFLVLKVNNTKYVALNTLLTVVNYEPQLVQRHRATILLCLVDLDISIRRRALELSFAILNEQNIRVISRELLLFLENSDVELKSYVTTQLTLLCEKYSPNDKWHFDTLVKMLTVAGNYVTNDIVSNILLLVMSNTDQLLTSHLLVALFQLTKTHQQYGLTLVTVWCLGEYSDLILDRSVDDVVVSEAQITLRIAHFIDSTSFYNKDQANVDTLVSYAMTLVLKLSSRFKSASEIEKLRQLLILQNNNANLEIQTRSIEYLEIMHQPEALKRGLLEKMPAPPLKHREAISLTKQRAAVTKKVSHPTTTEDLLLDLMGDDAASEPQLAATTVNTTHENTVDLLSDIFGSIGAPAAPAPLASTALDDLFATNTTNNASLAPATFSQPQPHQLALPQTHQQPFITVPADLLIAHESANVKIGFLPTHTAPGEASIETYILSNSATPISKVNLLIAVAKSQKLKISSTSKNAIVSMDDFIKQTLSISGKAGAKIKLRVKISYEIDTGAVEEQFDFAGFGFTL